MDDEVDDFVEENDEVRSFSKLSVSERSWDNFEHGLSTSEQPRDNSLSLRPLKMRPLIRLSIKPREFRLSELRRFSLRNFIGDSQIPRNLFRSFLLWNAPSLV